MKHIAIKTAALALLSLGMASCTDELNISPIDPQSSNTYDAKQLLAKQYATLGLTGQKGPDGSADLSVNEGESGFYRTVFNLQELNSDEILWAWQKDDDMAPITNMAWNSSSMRVDWCYQRLVYDITLYNQFISYETGKMSDDIIAEVRFLRALNYYCFLDLFHKAPFKTEYNTELPVEKAGADLYKWIDEELTAIEPIMKDVGAYHTAQDWGRADRGAAYALHARLALNSEVYTDGAVKDYAKAKQYCDKILESRAYDLSRAKTNGYSGYQQLFMADNDENPEAMKEIILPIRQDGLKTRNHGATTMLINGTRKSGMPYYYQTNPWQCIFARKDLIQKFFPALDIPMASSDDYAAYIKDNKIDASKLTEADILSMDEKLGGSTKQILDAAKDDRAIFYAGVGGADGNDLRTLEPEKEITGFLNGLSIVKWTNMRSDNGKVHGDNFCDTDVPLFRLAEIYLTRAEAKFRLGEGDLGLSDINELEKRAHRALSSSVTEGLLIDEWCREFYLEGRRRSDLNRFGLYTGSKYLWSFKGGQKNGRGVDPHFWIYPIPAGEISGNKNLTQNPDY